MRGHLAEGILAKKWEGYLRDEKLIGPRSGVGIDVMGADGKEDRIYESSWTEADSKKAIGVVLQKNYNLTPDSKSMAFPTNRRK